MIKRLLIFLRLLLAGIASAAYTPADNKLNSATSIDLSDTMVFDISQAVILGNQIAIPVFFHSDDTVYALDFSFKYNHACFSYDTIINLTTYLSEFSNYNQGDSTVYFTSYSLQPITNDTPLVSIQFTINCGYFCSDDLISVLAYLNGDACSVNVINCLTDKISKADKEESIFLAYPNPASESINIETTEEAAVQLLDINGSQVLLQTKAEANRKQVLDIRNIAGGIYLLKIFNDHFNSNQKVVISNQNN